MGHMTLLQLLKINFIFNFIFLLSAAVVNLLYEDFDSSTWLLRDDDDVKKTNQTSHLETLALNAVNALNKWDSVYFNHISQFGYTYEQMLAFYPAFPYLVSFIVSIIQKVSNSIPEYLLVKAVGILSSVSLNMMATAFLYKLTTCIFTKNPINEKLKNKYVTMTTLAFIFNPANIFMTSSYTESLFVTFQFASLLAMEHGYFAMASGLVGLTMLTRSNGMLNIVFLAYFVFKQHFHPTSLIQVLGLRIHILEILHPQKCFQFLEKCLRPLLLLITVYLPLCLLPYSIWQYLVYRMFCKLPSYTSLTNPSHWCKQTIPFSYSYIQNEYWNVGFLRYYEIKQIPNFFLATPICCLIFLGVYMAIIDTENAKFTIRWIGLKRSLDSVSVISLDSSFVYLCHVLFLTLFGLLNVHVQILTRMLCSSSPFVYWTVAELILSAKLTKKFQHRCIRFIVVYFTLYNILGLFLHCNFYPWT